MDSVGIKKLPAAGEQGQKPAKTIAFVTCLLLALLGMRLVANLIMGLPHPFFAFDIPAYLAAIIGVLRKARWGSLLAVGYHGVSLIFAFSFILGSFLTLDYQVWQIFLREQGGSYVLGASVTDILIVGLAWREYATLRSSATKKKESDPEQW